MIKRYSRKEATEIWDEKNKYSIWLEIEIAAAQAMEKLSLIPKGVATKVKRKARINVDRDLADDLLLLKSDPIEVDDISPEATVSHGRLGPTATRWAKL